jgi:dienelactone hydrolase
MARWLRRHCGCERLVAIGVGVGGLIAYRAIIDDAPIDDLVLWGVRASGRAYVRELRAYAAVTAPPDGADDAREDGAIGIGGHVMSVETAAALGSIDLTRLTLPDSARRRVLLIGRDTHGVDAKLHEHLCASGAELTLLESDDYRALMSPPDLGRAPTRTFAAANKWVLGDASRPAVTAATPTTTSAQAAHAVTFEHEGVAIRERLTTVETAEGTLRGIISEPVGAGRGTCCLVTVNSGALRHTGPNRIFVELARRAAAAGVSAARFDLPGLGDSDGTAIRSFERTEADDRTSLAVMGAIYDHLEGLGLPDRFVAGGFSLGGYLTVRAATSDRRVTGALCVNPTGFVWTDKQRARVYKDLVAIAGPDALVAETAPGQAPVSRPGADRLGRLCRRLDAAARRRLARSELLWRLEHRRELSGLGGRLDELAVAGTQMLVLLSRDEPLLRMLRRPGPAGKLARCPAIRIGVLATDDHLLRPLAIQATVIERFVARLTEISSAPGNTVPGVPRRRLRVPGTKRGVTHAKGDSH